MKESIITPKKPQAFRAVQFKNEDAEKIREALRDCVERTGSDSYEVDTMFGRKQISDGDWIIAASDADIFVITNEEFEADFVQIGTRVPIESEEQKTTDIIPISHRKN